MKLSSLKPNFNSCYEYPYSFCTILDLKREEIVKLVPKASNEDALMMNQNILTINRLRENI